MTEFAALKTGLMTGSGTVWVLTLDGRCFVAVMWLIPLAFLVRLLTLYSPRGERGSGGT